MFNAVLKLVVDTPVVLNCVFIVNNTLHNDFKPPIIGFVFRISLNVIFLASFVNSFISFNIFFVLKPVPIAVIIIGNNPTFSTILPVIDNIEVKSDTNVFTPSEFNVFVNISSLTFFKSCILALKLSAYFPLASIAKPSAFKELLYLCCISSKLLINAKNCFFCRIPADNSLT